MSTLAPDDPSKIVITTPDSGVAELQRVLTTYAQITGFTPANPGPVDGLVGVKTAMAVIAMLPRTPGVPGEVANLAPVLSLMLSTTDGQKQVYGIIKRNASSISRAIIALEAYRVATGGNVVTPPPTTSAGGKASWALTHSSAILPGVLAPVTNTGVPTNPSTTIWFYDSWRKQYRVAVPRGTLNGFNNYVEVAPSDSRPNAGTEVGRSAFFSATGQWWMTPLGMVAIGAGTIGAGFAVYKGARWVLG